MKDSLEMASEGGVLSQRLSTVSVRSMRWALLFLLATAGATTAHAATVSVDCNKKGSINTELAKLDKSAVNVLVVSGRCLEDIIIDGHRDLTIRRVNPSIQYRLNPTSSVDGNTVVTIRGASKVTFDRAIIENGDSGVLCDDHSMCRFTGYLRLSGRNGVGIGVQAQSSLDVIDSDPGMSSNIYMDGGRALGVFGNSSANLNFTGATEGQFGYVATGAFNVDVVAVQDGSFLRVDNGLIDSARGVVVQRGAIAKILNTEVRVYGPSDVIWSGIFVRAATLQFEGNKSITGAPAPIVIGPLSFARVAGTGTSPLEIISTSAAVDKFAVTCAHATAVAQLQNVTPGTNLTNCAQ